MEGWAAQLKDCPICNKAAGPFTDSTTRVYSLLYHLTKHSKTVPPGNKDYRCFICNIKTYPKNGVYHFQFNHTWEELEKACALWQMGQSG